MSSQWRLILILLFALQGVGRGAQAPTPNPAQGRGARGGGGAVRIQTAFPPIEFLIDPPTLINLGFEWFIQGDENRNATSRYRTERKAKLNGNRHCQCCV